MKFHKNEKTVPDGYTKKIIQSILLLSVKFQWQNNNSKQ